MPRSTAFVALLFGLFTSIAVAQTTRPAAAMIWTRAAAPPTGLAHAAFRKTFDLAAALAAAPASATLGLFAYTRYVFVVNGEYVCRGPSRFENARPEYDAIDVASHLRAGPNVIAILVHRDLPSGRGRQHAPGLTARLDVDGTTTPRPTRPGRRSSTRPTAQRSRLVLV